MKALLGQFSSTDERRIDWATDTIKVALLSEYEPNQDEHDFFADVAAKEIEGTGYTAGGKTLGEAAASTDAATNSLRLKAKDSEWTEATFAATHAVLYKDTGEDATSPLIGYIDFDGKQEITSGTLKIEWDGTDGVAKIVAS